MLATSRICEYTMTVSSSADVLRASAHHCQHSSDIFLHTALGRPHYKLCHEPHECGMVVAPAAVLAAYLCCTCGCHLAPAAADADAATQCCCCCCKAAGTGTAHCTSWQSFLAYLAKAGVAFRGQRHWWSFASRVCCGYQQCQSQLLLSMCMGRL